MQVSIPYNPGFDRWDPKAVDGLVGQKTTFTMGDNSVQAEIVAARKDGEMIEVTFDIPHDSAIAIALGKF